MSVNRTVLQRFPVPELPGYESRLVHFEIPPGVGVPLHNHPVPGNGIVISGDLISHYEGYDVQRYTAGDAIEDLAGVLHLEARNANDDKPLVFVMTYIIPPDEENTLIPPQNVPPEKPECSCPSSGGWRSWLRL